MKRVWIAGGTGYIGQSVVAAAREAGLQPVVLTRSAEKAEKLRSEGLDAVVGDLERPGDWAKALRCEQAVFVAAPPTWGKRVSRAVATHFRDGLVVMTRNFLDACAAQPIEHAVYIAGTSYYGDAGDGEPRTEDWVGPPKGWGPYLAPAVDLALERIAAGLPLVLAFPGQVYGPASWTEQLFLTPIAAGKSVTGLRGYAPMMSCIHVEDCGRAVGPLLEHGVAGQRYFLVANEPARFRELGVAIAAALERPLYERSVPRWLCSLLIGPVLTEYATAHTNFSNGKLAATGFSYRYPTFRDGVPDVVRRWQETRG